VERESNEHGDWISEDFENVKLRYPVPILLTGTHSNKRRQRKLYRNIGDGNTEACKGDKIVFNKYKYHTNNA
jgi:hypothetical protein